MVPRFQKACTFTRDLLACAPIRDTSQAVQKQNEFSVRLTGKVNELLRCEFADVGFSVVFAERAILMHLSLRVIII